EHAHCVAWANDAIAVMNSISPPGASPSGPCTSAQRSALEHVTGHCRRLSKPSEERRLREGALGELLAGSPLYESGGPTRPYARDSVSWPRAGEHAAPLQGLLNTPDTSWLEDWRLNMLRRITSADIRYSDGELLLRGRPVHAAPTASAFSDLEAEGGRCVVAADDITNAFYQMRMPSGMEHYFRLPPIDSSFLRAAGVPDLPDGAVQGCITVMPMGFSWSTHLCQRVLRDGRPAVSLSQPTDVGCAGYVDNYLAVGTNAARVNAVVDQVSEQLQRVGIHVHDAESASGDCTFLGLELRAGRWLSVKGRNVWRLRYAIEEVLRRKKVSGHLLRILLGHITWTSLVRREALALLNTAYAFVEVNGVDLQELWPAVRRELWQVRRFLPLLACDLSAPWSSHVTCSDASEFGLGVCRRRAPRSEVARIGRVSERWRYRVDGFQRAQESALRDEAEALLLSYRHLLRSSSCFGCRLLAFVDNLPLCLAVWKGRASSPLLKVPLLKIAMLSLATGPRRERAAMPRARASPRRRLASGPTDAVRRRMSLATALIESSAPCGTLSPLELAAVRPATQAAHRALLNGFVAFCSAHRLDWSSMSELDEATGVREVSVSFGKPVCWLPASLEPPPRL
ncbi:unnamed protein product, partial [Prorocentrum cordatum]